MSLKGFVKEFVCEMVNDDGKGYVAIEDLFTPGLFWFVWVFLLIIPFLLGVFYSATMMGTQETSSFAYSVFHIFLRGYIMELATAVVLFALYKASQIKIAERATNADEPAERGR